MDCQFTDTMDYPLKLHFEVNGINFGKVQKWSLAILNRDLFSNPTGIDYLYSNESKINIPLEEGVKFSVGVKTDIVPVKPEENIWRTDYYVEINIYFPDEL
ncbi:hypothetical protein [uncultured Gilliamella sp.]|uniref:hypothetical protein n=1 Tax=uncultured Gilliamella sp. TaxID=1193505 RepID=UPI0025DFA5A6|nr:hypothetical protein [uncultured Gilliamella sp.]